MEAAVDPRTGVDFFRVEGERGVASRRVATGVWRGVSTREGGAVPTASGRSTEMQGYGVGFFQSSNLLNLFFPRNVAAVSKLLIAIRKGHGTQREGERGTGVGGG